MIFSTGTGRATSYISSLFRYLKARGGETKHQEERRDEVQGGRTIIRCAHTDFSLVKDDDLGWIICFGACINIDERDIDFGYFNQSFRSGIVTATVHDNGAIEFDPEFDLVADRDDEESLDYQFQSASSLSSAQPSITTNKDAKNPVVLEMV